MALGRPPQDCEEDADSGPDSDPGSDEDLDEEVVAAEERQTRVVTQATPAVVPCPEAARTSSGDPAKTPSPPLGRPKRGPSTTVKAMHDSAKGKASENKPLTGSQQATDKQPADDSTKLKRGLIIGGAAVLVGVAAPFVLPALGFTAAGVGAGTVAAAWQASIGNVAAGSVFSVLQSVGAVGLGAKGIAVAGAVGAGIG